MHVDTYVIGTSSSHSDNTHLPTLNTYRVTKTLFGAAGGHTAVTEVTWFEKTDPDGQFVMTKKWKRSSKRDQQRRLNIPATKEESLEQAKAAAKHGEYILAKAKGGYEGTVKAVDGVNTLLEQIGLEIQIFSKDGHDGIRLACEEGNDTGNDYQAGERLAVDQSVLNICEALASANVSDDYWSIDV